jgi:hypothetical protein
MRWVAIASQSIEDARRCYEQCLHAAVMMLVSPEDIGPIRAGGNSAGESIARRVPSPDASDLGALPTGGQSGVTDKPRQIAASSLAATPGGAFSQGVLAGRSTTAIRDEPQLASPMQATYQMFIARPVESAAPVYWYGYPASDPLIVNPWGYYYNPPSYYEGGIVDYSAWWQYSPGTQVFRVGRGRIFRRGGDTVRYYMRTE